MAETKLFTDLAWQKSFWDRIKNIPANTLYTLGSISQTIKAAIDDLYTKTPVGGTAKQVWTSKGNGAGEWADVPEEIEECTEDEIKALFLAKTA